MRFNHSGPIHWRQNVLVLVAGLWLTGTASADTFFVSVDEWGKGFICDGTGSTISIPLCMVDPITHLASFARIPSGFSSDPTLGGGTHVLTYNLPFNVGTFDVFMTDNGMVDNDADLLRFLGTQLLFYSKQSIGTGDCSTMTPPATGCDGVADVPVIPGSSGGAVGIVEVGPPGDGSGLFIISGFEFNFQSDELTMCPANVPNCGPLNIAPPPNNPFRDITGLNAAPMQVMLAVGQNFNPLDVATPEPSSMWLFLAGVAGILFLHRRSCRRTGSLS